LSVNPTQGFIIRHIFDGWSGDINDTQPSVTLIMDSPKTVTTAWHTDYLQLYILIPVLLIVVGIVTTIILIRRKRAISQPPAATPPTYIPPPPGAGLPPPPPPPPAR
jgi:hypothetical protein